MATCDILSQCVLTSGVPKEYTKSQVCKAAEKHLKEGNHVVNASLATGRTEKTTTWVLQLSSKEAARKLYSEVVQEELCVGDDQRVSIRYDKPQMFQVPEAWQSIQVNMKSPSTEDIRRRNDSPLFVPRNDFPVYSSGDQLPPGTETHHGYKPALTPPTPGQTATQTASPTTPVYMYPLAAQSLNQTNRGYKYPLAQSNQNQIDLENQYPPTAPTPYQNYPENQYQPDSQSPGRKHPGNQYPPRAPTPRQNYPENQYQPEVQSPGRTQAGNQYPPKAPTPYQNYPEKNLYQPEVQSPDRTEPGNQYPPTASTPYQNYPENQYQPGVQSPGRKHPGNQYKPMAQPLCIAHPVNQYQPTPNYPAGQPHPANQYQSTPHAPAGQQYPVDQYQPTANSPASQPPHPANQYQPTLHSPADQPHPVNHYQPTPYAPTGQPHPLNQNQPTRHSPVGQPGNQYQPPAQPPYQTYPGYQYQSTVKSPVQTHPRYQYSVPAQMPLPGQLNPGYRYPAPGQTNQSNQYRVKGPTRMQPEPGNQYYNIPFIPRFPLQQPFPTSVEEAQYQQIPIYAGFAGTYGQEFSPYTYHSHQQMHGPVPYLPDTQLQHQQVFTPSKQNYDQEHEDDLEAYKEKHRPLKTQTKNLPPLTQQGAVQPQSNNANTAQKKERQTNNFDEEKYDDSKDLDSSVKVEGIASISPKQNLELYFENKRRSGGGDIECIRYDVLDEDVMYIQYKNVSDARAVLARKQNFNGQELHVSPYASLPYSDDKVLIEGVIADTTRDCLFNFLEAKADCSPIDMHVHAENKDIVLVVMDTTIDFKKLEQACLRHKLKGATLSLSRVTESNCILVTNLPPKVTSDTLEYYFENIRKSGGGPVEKVKLNEDRTACLIYFENYKDTENVVRKTQRISNVQLKVEHYQQCMGLPPCFTRQISIPNDFKLKTLDLHKLTFLRRSTGKQDALKEKLFVCYATVELPSDKEDEVTFHCTIKDDNQDELPAIENWEKDVSTTFTKFMDDIIVNHTVVPQEDWQMVVKNLRSITIDKPDLVMVELNSEKRNITIIGEKEVAEPLSLEIENIKDEQIRATEMKKTNTKETVTTLKPIELRMLNLTGFPRDIMGTISTIKVSIDDECREIVLEGPQSDINEAKLKMYEAKNKVCNEKIKVSDDLCSQLYQSHQTKEYITQILKERQFKCLFEVTADTIFIYSENKETLETGVKMIRRAVVLHKIEVNKDSVEYLETNEFEQKIDEIQSKNKGKVVIGIDNDAGCVRVCTVENLLEDIVCEIDDDISKNASLQKKVNCTRVEAVFIDRYKRETLTDITQKLKTHRVKIYPIQNRTGFIIRGPKDGIIKGKVQIENLLKLCKHRDHTFRKPNFATFITTPEGRDNLNSIENDLSCLITIKSHYDDPPVRSAHSAGKGKALNIFATYRMQEKIEIQTVQCDVTQLRVSVIVNNTDDKLSLNHGLGKVLAIKGGREVKESCCDFIETHGKLKECQVFLSPAGKLNAKYILHVTVPKWKRGHDAEDKMSTAIFNCLDKAEEYGCSSVAIPAVGCGAARYPPDTATDAIVKAIEKFFNHKGERTVTKIMLCDMKHGVVEEFTRALQDAFGRKRVTLLKKEENRETGDMPSKRQEMEGRGKHDKRKLHSENVDKVTLGNITVSILRGSVAKQKVDVIVNVVDKTLDLKRGMISATLLDNGGTELQQELKTKCPNGLEYGQIALTTGQKLPCRYIIHSRLGVWSKENRDSSVESLHTFVNTCLTGAVQQNVSSVVFPAVGTGKLGYPKDIAAREMFTSIADFSHNNKQQSTLKEVRIVVYQNDFSTIKAFEDEISFWETGERHCPRELRNMYQDIDDSDSKIESKGRANTKRESSDGKSYRLGQIKVTVKQGDILDEDADCIVNSIPYSMDLKKGAVSKEIYRRCGEEITTEMEKKKDWFRKYNLITTSAPNLGCRFVIHVAVQESTDGWRKVVEKCLKKADDNKLSSIAFPALGTSYRNEPKAMADCILSALTHFAKTKPKYVSDVRLVIYKSDMLPVFQEAFSYASEMRGEQNKQLHKYSGDPDSITFTIMATEYAVIDRAVSKIEKCYDQKDFHDKIIKTFNRYHTEQLKEIESHENVSIVLDKNTGKIQIRGLQENVSTATDKIHSIIRKALEFEKNKALADLVSQEKQWFFTKTGGSGQKLVPFEKPINYMLEQAYKSDKASHTFRDPKMGMFKVDFKQMKGHPVDKPSTTITVVRKDIANRDGSINVPAKWASMTGNLCVIPLANTDQEYIDTKNAFTTSVGGNSNVLKIERVQNKALWQQYQAKKRQIEQANPPGTKNESLLWHGSSDAGIENIKVHGFDRSYSDMSCWYGVGVYFSPMATVSSGYAQVGSAGVRRMFYCRVLTGEYTQGQASIRYPPPKPAGGQHAKYDCVVDNMSTPSEFVIFNDTQAYPEYLISFQP